MTSDPTLEIFLRRWRAALRQRTKFSSANWWEGRQAYAELKRTGYLDRVRLQDKSDEGSARGSGLAHFTVTHDLPKICAEIAAYRRYLGSAKTQIEFQKDSKEWLRCEADRVRKKAKFWQNREPTLMRDMNRIAKEIDRAARGVRTRFEKRWSSPLPVFAPPIRGHDKLAQARQLDSRFQVRLAVIFRADMPKNPFPGRKGESGPSLRTIARLIVLFLVCADLAEEREGQVKLRYNGRTITVSGVLQQLQGADIDRDS
jgi:hypothetical protein